MKNLLTAFLALAVSLSTFSCKPYDDTDDPNVIVDDQGIKLELTWSNSAADPTDETTLSLQVREGTNTLLSDSGWFEFSELEIENTGLNNGTYGIVVGVYDIDRTTNYKLTATGLSSGKSYSADFGPINVNDLYATLYPWTMTVSGTKYKFTL